MANAVCAYPLKFASRVEHFFDGKLWNYIYETCFEMDCAEGVQSVQRICETTEMLEMFHRLKQLSCLST